MVFYRWHITFYLLISSLGCFSSLFCQQSNLAKIEQLKGLLLSDTISPRIRIATNLRLVSTYKFAHEDVDSLIHASLVLAEANGFKFYEARSLKFRARFRLYLNEDPALIFEDIKRIEQISKNFENSYLPFWISNLYTQYYLQIGDVKAAKINLDSLESRSSKVKQKELPIIHTIKGMYYQSVREYEKAIDHFSTALNMPQSGKSYIYNNLSSLFTELEDYDKAKEFAEMSLRNSEYVDNSIPMIASYILLGDVNLAEGDTVEAIKCYEKSETMRKVPFFSKNYSALSRLISIYSITNPSVVPLLLKDIDSYQRTEDYPLLLTAKGNSEIQNKNYSIAEYYCSEALDLSDQRLDYSAALTACDCLIKVSDSQKDLKKSSQLLRKKADLQKALFDKNRLKSLARQLAKFESEKEKELLSQAYEQEQRFLQEKLKRQRYVGILGCLILLIIMYSWYQLRNKNILINKQNEEIQKALAEKDLLLREIHHRVKNNLQLVSSLLTLQGGSIDDKIAQKAIQEGKSRVMSMALIHQDLYNKEDLTAINVKEYLDKLTSELFSTYSISQNRIDLRLAITDIDLDVDTLVPIGLILNELITNSLKYAFPNDEEGYISIQIYEKEEKLFLIVEDNGIGFQKEDFNSNSFGSTLISSLVDQLDGTMIKTHQNGTKILIELKDYKN